MGYAFYDTPMGEAGYSVEDICHKEGCDEEIDRGLGFLCGNTPGQADEYGCGRWFCGDHLCCAPAEVEIIGGLCEADYARWEAEHPEVEESEG